MVGWWVVFLLRPLEMILLWCELLRLAGGWQLAYCHADEDATWVPTQEREIGFVFQSYALFKHMTCAENIAFGPSIRKMGMDIDSR